MRQYLPLFLLLSAVACGSAPREEAEPKGEAAPTRVSPPPAAMRAPTEAPPAPAPAPPAAAAPVAPPEPAASPEPAAAPPTGGTRPPQQAPTGSDEPSVTVPKPAAPIEDASGKAMTAFYQALARTQAREKGAITRISHYGTSILGSDGPTHVSRKLFQDAFGDAGKGWVNVGKGWKWYLPRGVKFKSHGWRSRTVVNHKLNDGWYGYGGVAAIGSPGARTEVVGEADRIELWYKSAPKSGKLGFGIGDSKGEEFDISSDEPTEVVKVFEDGQPGPKKITVRATGGGPVRVFGMVLEKNGPGVVYDTVPLIGARGSRLLKFDEAHLARQMKQRRPDLVVANFGGNEMVDVNMNLSVYERQYKKALERLFAGAKGASCLIVGPTDHAREVDGRLVPDPMLPRIVDVQRRMAKELGCAFWDAAEATGGHGIALRTQKTKQPLYYKDYTHLTPAGDKKLGEEFYNALVTGYQAWKAAQ